MPDKTHGELIRELLGSTAVLEERVETVRLRTDRLEVMLSRVAEQVHELDKKIALQDQHLTELRETRNEWGRRIWMIVAPVVAAAVGALIGYLLRG